jgi:hypothetical protein
MDNMDDFKKAMKDYTWIDTPTMYDLSEEQYKDFIKSTFHVDHHDVLRLGRGSDGAPPLVSLSKALKLMQMSQVS